MVVKQTMLSQNRNSLLGYAISRLSPEVFSHPVWVQFGKKEVSTSLKIVDDLLSVVKNLQGDDPDTACQVLLISAVYQNNAGQHDNALKTIQQALALAQSSSLYKEVIWSIWGACAITLQQGNHEQVAENLLDLQAVLSEQNEWMLANFVDVLRPAFSQPVVVNAGKGSGSSSEDSFEDMLAFTFVWFQHWGDSTHILEHDAPQYSSTVPLPPIEEIPSLKAASGGKIHNMKSIKDNKNQHNDKVIPVTPVAVHMLGTFSMAIGDLTLKLPASRGLSLFKYLLLHHKQSVSREVLMDIFWPDAEPEMARNNLNVSMHNLRKALFIVTDVPMIIYESGLYSLASDLQIWLDVKEFEKCVKAGKRLDGLNQLAASTAEYEAAISLYQGDFLEQNPYEEWTIVDRDRLRIAYLDTLDRLSQIYFNQEHYAQCIAVCQLILARDRCHENAHCLLMRCYSRQNQYHLALRQFQTCVEALRDELDVGPAPETLQLYEKARQRERV